MKNTREEQINVEIPQFIKKNKTQENNNLKIKYTNNPIILKQQKKEQKESQVLNIVNSVGKTIRCVVITSAIITLSVTGYLYTKAQNNLKSISQNTIEQKNADIDPSKSAIIDNTLSEFPIDLAKVQQERNAIAAEIGDKLKNNITLLGAPGNTAVTNLQEDINKQPGNTPAEKVQNLLKELRTKKGPTGKTAWQDTDYSNTDPTGNGRNRHYDLNHLRAYEFGLKPRFLSATMGLESGGDELNPRKGPNLYCFGLFQINKAEWSSFEGMHYIKLDGTIGTITMDGCGYDDWSKRNYNIPGNCWDPEANSYVGAYMLKYYSNKYKSPWVVYGCHNGGEAFAAFIRKYNNGTTEGITLERVQELIHTYCTDTTKTTKHGWCGETDLALEVLSKIYNAK